MEGNVVSLETAKRLQSAGFPQDMAFEWLERPRNKPEYRWELAQTWHSKHIQGGYAAPTAQELADQLPEALNVIRHTGSWTATVDRGIGRPVVADSAVSLAEALANLWIKLREPKR